MDPCQPACQPSWFLSYSVIIDSTSTKPCHITPYLMYNTSVASLKLPMLGDFDDLGTYIGS